MKSPLTLKDIANIVGVSVSTVSKALNDSHEIGEDTKFRINKIANTYNYKRNSLAYNLRSKRTNTIGIVLPELSTSYVASVVDGISHILNLNNYRLMFYQTRDLYTNELKAFETLSKSSVDGLIIAPSLEAVESQKLDHFYTLAEKEMPFVIFDRIGQKIASL